MVKKVKIVSSIYDIKYLKTVLGEKKKVLLGIIEYDHLYIKINNSYPKAIQLKSLLHKSIHGISKEFQLNISEKNVARLSNGFFCLILENKDFIREILKL